jgi:hypothetical protein
VGVFRQSNGDSRCVKDPRRESLRYLSLTRLVSRRGSVSLWCVRVSVSVNINASVRTSVIASVRASTSVVSYENAGVSIIVSIVNFSVNVSINVSASANVGVQPTMSDGGRPQPWAKAAAERAAREKLTTMPGVREAQARVEKLAAAAKFADQARAERTAQNKEAQKVLEAQTVRKIQKSLELLSMDDTWSLKAQTWSEDQHLLLLLQLHNLVACAQHAGRNVSRGSPRDHTQNHYCNGCRACNENGDSTAP